MYGCEGELPEEFCAFVRLKDIAYKYQELIRSQKMLKRCVTFEKREI